MRENLRNAEVDGTGPLIEVSGVLGLRHALAKKVFFILGRRIEMDERREEESESAMDSSRASKSGEGST